MAGVEQAHRRPAGPRDEEHLVRLVVLDAHRVPVVGPEVHVELHGRAVVPAVVVAVRGPQPGQVLGAGHRGQRVAVAHAGREAPDRLEAARPLPLVLGGHLEILAGVGVCAVGDVDDAAVGILVAAVLVVQAAVDAEEPCILIHTFIQREMKRIRKATSTQDHL